MVQPHDTIRCVFYKCLDDFPWACFKCGEAGVWTTASRDVLRAVRRGQARVSSKPVRARSMGSGNGRRHGGKPMLLILLNFFNHLPVLEYEV